MRKATFIIIGLLLFLLIGGAALAMSSANFNLHWSALSGGGGERSSASYILNDNTGGLPAGGMSDNYKLGSVLQYTASGVEYIPGDANGDKVVNIFDMTKIARIILELD
jgi:hypothetical protein